MSIEFVEKKRWLFLGLPFTFTKYVIKEDMITVDTGVFTKVENDCYMYKVQDVEHTASIWERMVGLGTNALYDLSKSTAAKDREFYHEFCRFVLDNPMRK